MFTDAIESGLRATEKLLDGDMPSKAEVAKVIDAGMTIAGAAALFGVGEDVIRELIDE